MDSSFVVPSDRIPSGMRLTEDLWKNFEAYLLYDLKFSDKPQARSANKSRFVKVVQWFHEKDFTRQNFMLFVGELKQHGYSNSYINNLAKTVLLLGHFLKVDEIKDYTYYPECKLPPRETLSPDEIIALANLKVSYQKKSKEVNIRQYALILLMGITGCRIGEILALTWDCLHDNPPSATLRDTKNNEERVVILSKEVYGLLLALPKTNNRVFNSYRGGVLTEHAVNNDLKRRAKQLGWTKNVYNHLFRSSYIRTMVDTAEVDWFSLSPLLGHKNPATTMHYYLTSLKRAATVARKHPLLRGDVTWEEKVKDARESLQNIFGIEHPMNIEVKEGQLRVTIMQG